MIGENMEKEKKKINSYNKDNIRWLIMLLCIIIFLIITYTLFQNQIEQFDNRIYKMLASYISEPLTSIFKIITNFGGAICICTITAGILILVKNKKYGIYTFINLLIIAFINQTLKYIIQSKSNYYSRWI